MKSSNCISAIRTPRHNMNFCTHRTLKIRSTRSLKSFNTENNSINQFKIRTKVKDNIKGSSSYKRLKAISLKHPKFSFLLNSSKDIFEENKIIRSQLKEYDKYNIR